MACKISQIKNLFNNRMADLKMDGLKDKDAIEVIVRNTGSHPVAIAWGENRSNKKKSGSLDEAMKNAMDEWLIEIDKKDVLKKLQDVDGSRIKSDKSGLWTMRGPNAIFGNPFITDSKYVKDKSKEIEVGPDNSASYWYYKWLKDGKYPKEASKELKNNLDIRKKTILANLNKVNGADILNYNGTAKNKSINHVKALIAIAEEMHPKEAKEEAVKRKKKEAKKSSSTKNNIAGSDKTNKDETGQVAVDSNQTGLQYALTNPTHTSPGGSDWTKGDNATRKMLSPGIKYEGHAYKDVEEAFQKNKDKDEAKTKPNKKNSTNYKLMVDLIRIKLQTYPRLVSGINNAGGLDYLNKVIHQPTNKNSVWETGGKDWFKLALIEAYNAVNSNVKVQDEYYTREEVKANPNNVYLFGDNTHDRTVTKHTPRSTQALIRGLDNTLGIDTKKDRGTGESSYFKDRDIGKYKKYLGKIYTRIKQLQAKGKTIVLPRDGIGTGKAKLSETPELYNELAAMLNDVAGYEYMKPISSGKGFQLTDRVKWTPKDQLKASEANAYIGYPVAGRQSSTGTYLEDAKRQGIPVNEFIKPTKDTIAYVSVNGKSSAGRPDFESNLNKTKKVIAAILKAGGTIIMDTEAHANHSHNRAGEGKIQADLMKAVLDGKKVAREEIISDTVKVNGKPVGYSKLKLEVVTKNQGESRESKEGARKIKKILTSPKMIEQYNRFGKDCSGQACAGFSNTAKGELLNHEDLVEFVFETKVHNVEFNENKDMSHFITIVKLKNDSEIYVIDGDIGKYMSHSDNGELTVDEGAVPANHLRVNSLRSADYLKNRKTGMLEVELHDSSYNFEPEDMVAAEIDYAVEYSEDTNSGWIRLNFEEKPQDDNNNEVTPGSYHDKIDNELAEILPKNNKSTSSKYELFPGVYANATQQEAIDELVDFLDSDEATYVLKGRGGTGKTTIVNKVLETAKISSYEVFFTTISHKAKHVIEKANQSSAYADSEYAVTDSSLFLYGKPGKTTSNLMKAEPEVIVVDEASMVNNDILNKIEGQAKSIGAKVIYMGDNVQLPPVKSEPGKDSPVFDTNRYPNVSTLTERMRQGEESPILPVTDILADFVEGKKKGLMFDTTNVESDKGTVLYMEDSNKTINNFVEDFKENPEGTRYVWYNKASHRETVSLVRKIRERLYGKKGASQKYVEGEQITLNDNYGDLGKSSYKGFNSSEYTVKGVEESSGTTLFYREYEDGKPVIKSFEYKGPVHHITVISNITGDGQTLIAPTGNFKESTKGLPPKARKELADISYAYVISSHKAQGSTYETVYTNVKNILFPGKRNVNAIDQAKSLYTATSRPTDKLVMVDVPFELSSKSQEPRSVSNQMNDVFDKDGGWNIEPEIEADTTTPYENSVAGKAQQQDIAQEDYDTIVEVYDENGKLCIV